MCSPHSEAVPLHSETIFGERLRQRGRERELTRHEVSQPETGGNRAQMATTAFSLRPGFYLFGLQQQKTSKIWVCRPGQRKVAETER